MRPYILGGEDPKESSNIGLKIEFFHFLLKFGLACRKIEASQKSFVFEILFIGDHC